MSGAEALKIVSDFSQKRVIQQVQRRRELYAELDRVIWLEGRHYPEAAIT